MGGDVDDFDVVALEDFAIVGVNFGAGEELFLALGGFGEVGVAEGDDFVFCFFVGFEMLLADAAAADEGDVGGIVFWVLRAIGEIGCLDFFGGRLGGEAVGGFFSFGHDQVTSGTVRRSRALWTAESTICWPIRQNWGERGPSTGLLFSMQWIRYCTGF